MINKWTGIGRLTKDPEVNILSTGKSVANFTIAVERPFADQNGKKGTDFIPVVAWDKIADLIKKYVSKGSMIAVHGRIQTRSYQTREGATRYVTEAVAEEIQFLDSRKKENKPETQEENYEQYGFNEVSEDWEDSEMPF